MLRRPLLLPKSGTSSVRIEMLEGQTHTFGSCPYRVSMQRLRIVLNSECSSMLHVFYFRQGGLAVSDPDSRLV